MFIDEDPLTQVKFVHLFKVTVLNLHVIMMKPGTKLINSAVRLSVGANVLIGLSCVLFLSNLSA